MCKPNNKLNKLNDFWKYVDKNGPVPLHRPDLGACWVWKGSIASNGYSRFYTEMKQFFAHRISYFLTNGPIPAGKQVDHLCRNRSCTNPAHLEAVTRKENLLRGESFSAINSRKTHCYRGHPFSGRNLGVAWSRGMPSRSCRKCAALNQMKYKKLKELREPEPESDLERDRR